MCLPLVLASCALLPVIPARTHASAGSCPHLPAAMVSTTITSSVRFSSGSSYGPSTEGGYCDFTGGSTADAFHISISGVSQSHVQGLITDIALGYQSGTVDAHVNPSAVLLPHPGGSWIEGCSATHCISIATSGITPPAAVLKTLLARVLATLDAAVPPSSTPAPTNPVLPSPCTLLSSYDIQSATGWYVTSTSAPSPNECAFSNYDDTMSVIVSVTPGSPSSFTLEKAAAPSPFSLNAAPAVAYGYVTTTNGVSTSRAVISWKHVEVRIVITTTESEEYALGALAGDVVSALQASSPSPTA